MEVVAHEGVEGCHHHPQHIEGNGNFDDEVCDGDLAHDAGEAEKLFVVEASLNEYSGFSRGHHLILHAHHNTHDESRQEHQPRGAKSPCRRGEREQVDVEQGIGGEGGEGVEGIAHGYQTVEFVEEHTVTKVQESGVTHE